MCNLLPRFLYYNLVLNCFYSEFQWIPLISTIPEDWIIRRMFWPPLYNLCVCVCKWERNRDHFNTPPLITHQIFFKNISSLLTHVLVWLISMCYNRNIFILLTDSKLPFQESNLEIKAYLIYRNICIIYILLSANVGKEISSQVIQRRATLINYVGNK